MIDLDNSLTIWWFLLLVRDFDFELHHLGQLMKPEMISVLKPFLACISLWLCNAHNMLVHYVGHLLSKKFNSFGNISKPWNGNVNCGKIGLWDFDATIVNYLQQIDMNLF
jgi:hypothetical protein